MIENKTTTYCTILCSRWLFFHIYNVNLPACHGHTPATGSAPSPLSAPSVRTPRACCRAASPVLPVVPGCCRTHPPQRCSRWQGWCHPRTGRRRIAPQAISPVQQRRPQPAAETGRSCWDRVLIFQSPAKGAAEKSANATRKALTARFRRGSQPVGMSIGRLPLK